MSNIKWQWTRPKGHRNQPLTEWWLEQVMCVIAIKVAHRAHVRGDRQTVERMVAIARAGAEKENQ